METLTLKRGAMWRHWKDMEKNSYCTAQARAYSCPETQQNQLDSKQARAKMKTPITNPSPTSTFVYCSFSELR